ncbi:zinc finger protein 143-like [Tigriopus californicus]|uniref:zinc finger protein 143-like n=1 Tax=Tigriopus californicus TaxID=6832 RepID=UPI0027DAA302|nr:zinc finger protein 143-like [Tigriopus californicus]
MELWSLPEDEKLITGISPLSESLSESPEADFITEVSLRDIPVVIESEEPWNLSKERGPLLNLPEVGATPPEPRDTKQYTCSVDGCHKVYTTQNHLKVHLRSHSGIKPFRCLHQNCGKSFATNYSLKAHTRVHTGDRPYGCKTCGKSFKTSGDMQKHVRIHTGVRPFVCQTCQKAFTTSNILKVHKRTHTGERPYGCEVCKKNFASHTNLKNHRRIHSGEKPYVCENEACGRRFTEYSSLFKHQLVHVPFKPFPCKFCDKGYRLESTLMLHLRTAHNYGPEEESYQQLGDQEGQDIGGNSSTIELQPPKINEPEQSPSNDTATTFVLQGSTRLFHLLENHEMLRNGMAEVMIVCTN